jgi:flagellar biosynthesis protein FlhF
MTEAMKMVRDDLGEDAVIVATREEDGGKTVSITAAIEHEESYYDDYFDVLSKEEDGGYFLADDFLEADDIDDENAVIEHLTDVMLRHSVPEDITDQIISCATVLGLEKPDVSLTAAIEHLFSFKTLPDKPNGTALLLAGPPGGGKSMAAAKLAARAIIEGGDATLISVDTIRAGGLEQLKAFTEIMQTPLHLAKDHRELKDILDDIDQDHQIIIDTGAMNAFDPEEMRELARFVAAGDIEPVLVMPAGLDSGESGEIARAYGPLGVRYMLPTRLDFARRLGGLLSAAHYGGLIITDASNTPAVANGLINLSPEKLVNLLMPETARKNKKTKTEQTKETKQKELTG